MEDQPCREMTLKEWCDGLRANLKPIELSIRAIGQHTMFHGEQAYLGQHKEMLAHAELAVRAIEEARMRLGKVLQYAGDGVSIFDKV